MKLIALLTIIFLSACGTSMNSQQLEKDAEQMAQDKCNLAWVTTKIEHFQKQAQPIEDSLKIESLDPTVKKRLEREKYRNLDKIDYFSEQRKGYLTNDKEEELKLRADKYKDPANWQKLIEKSELLLKKKNCMPNDM